MGMWGQQACGVGQWEFDKFIGNGKVGQSTAYADKTDEPQEADKKTLLQGRAPCTELCLKRSVRS